MRPETKKTENSLAAEACKRGIMARLAQDVRGNALMLTAAFLLPICAAIGGGVDMSRAYLAKARLNQACDAAALAARRSMTGLDITASANESARTEGTKFFNFNFPAGTMNTTPVNPNASGVSQGPTYTKPVNGTVRVTAATNVPTTIMKIFGYEQIPISVTCEALQNLTNIDIMLVLDTTGSMEGSRLTSLKDAVKALYKELAPAQRTLEAQQLRLRYAIVPYSSSVNVGKVLRGLNSNYIASTWTYQSREKKEVSGQNSSWCSARSGTRSGGICTYYEYKPISYNVSTNNSWDGCIEERQTVSTITGSSDPAAIPTDALDLDMTRIPDNNASRWGATWPEMIYLRNTSTRSNTETTSGSKMDTSGNIYGCPTEVQIFRVYSPKGTSGINSEQSADLETYLGKLDADGYTFHDIGMIWGARMLSRTGVFSADNPESFNNVNVERYVIFMTDGEMNPHETGGSSCSLTSPSGTCFPYMAYGVEYLDRRITGSGGYTGWINLRDTHDKRFLMACNAVKSMGAQVWTVTLNDTLPQTMIDCAGSLNRASLTTTPAGLIDEFATIGRNIGGLRLGL